MPKDHPEKLGKYDIVGKLGKGAMGEVYKGHDPVLNRHVAIKVIAEALDTDKDLVERFRREAKMAAQLNHPNIITIYDFVEEDGNLYIVMELLDGKDLKELIRSNEPLTVDQILGMMEQISDGLGFAHDSGMVHRDLKPANIHITKKGQIKILDFGLVHDASSDMTKTGHVMGTPNYMSPEQVQGLKVDPRSDIFSLGAVFYELLTRKKPFSADSIHATMFKVVQGEREPLSQYTQLPQPLVAMVDRALDPNPDGRFADGNDLRQHLREIRRMGLGRGEMGDSTLTSGMEGSTVLTPTGTASSYGSASSPSRFERSSTGRSMGGSVAGASASGSRGGTMRRREMAGQSMGSGSSFAQPSRPIGLYAAGGILVLAIAAGLWYFSSPRDGGPSVEELSQALLESQRELMIQSLEQRNYREALSQAEELLASEPQNADALRVQQEAQQALADIDAAVAEARAAMDQGATEEAANALSRVLALDPSHPLGTELHDQLNQHFQGQAEQARTDMERARSAASSAGATGRSEYQQAEQQRQSATSDFNSGEFTGAAQKYLAARDLYARSQSAHQQAQRQQQQQQQQRQAANQAQEREARQAFERAQTAYNRAKNQPAEQGMTELPSYRRAMSEEAAAREAERSGDLGAAARAYETAASYLETARQEYTEQQARLAAQQQQRQTQVAESAPTPSPSPPPAPAQPTVSDESLVRQALATYERAIETEDIALFRRIRPNTTPAEIKVVEDSFKTVDAHQVDLDIQAIDIAGDSATVVTTRRDTITVRGRSQNGNARRAVFTLSKMGGEWVIVGIQ